MSSLCLLDNEPLSSPIVCILTSFPTSPVLLSGVTPESWCKEVWLRRGSYLVHADGYSGHIHWIPDNIKLGCLPLLIELYSLAGLSVTAELVCNLQYVTYLALNGNSRYVRTSSPSRSPSPPQLPTVTVLSTNTGPIPNSASSWMPPAYTPCLTDCVNSYYSSFAFYKSKLFY